MYYYIYDEFVQDKKYEKELFVIENRLTDLGISGKIGRLALFKDAAELIKDEVKRGAENVIFVGNDQTIKKALKIIPEIKATFGIIPLGEDENGISKILGMPSGLQACDVLSARLVQAMDIGKVNDRYFLCRIFIPDTNISIRCEGTYKLSPVESGDIEIRNWGSIEKDDKNLGDPKDGLLDLIINTQVGKKRKVSTNLKLKNIDIRTREQIPVFIDEERVNGNSFKIKIARSKARWIVGRERKF